MLRTLVLLLLLVNLLWFSWAQGWLRPWGLAPAATSEPQRLSRQVQPEAIQVLRDAPSPAAAAPASAAASAAR